MMRSEGSAVQPITRQCGAGSVELCRAAYYTEPTAIPNSFTVVLCEPRNGRCKADKVNKSTCFYPPPPPPSAIPAGGVLVLKGNAQGLGGSNVLGCLLPGLHDATTTWPGMAKNRIAAQCCTVAGACHRAVNNRCIAGNSGRFNGAIEELTYAQTKERCNSFGLELCEKSCKDSGCKCKHRPAAHSMHKFRTASLRH